MVRAVKSKWKCPLCGFITCSGVKKSIHQKTRKGHQMVLVETVVRGKKSRKDNHESVVIY